MDGQDFPPPKLRATPAEARRVPTDPGRATALLMSHGTMELRWFAPGAHDPQTPHDRDELYIIVSGTGTFMRAQDSRAMEDDTSLPLGGVDRVPFGPGDAIFVPAGTEHRFEEFSGDFAFVAARPKNARNQNPAWSFRAQRRVGPLRSFDKHDR